MNSRDILYSQDGSSEKFTPPYAVKPILKYIPKDWVVWCCCDQEHSEYVQQIRKNGNKVIYSHIFDGQDFFKYEPKEHFDCIITNVPFKKKRLFIERALSFNKPFAILQPLTIFSDKYPAFSFYEKNKQMQLLKFDKRIHFKDIDGKVEKKTTFSSGYICCDFLPKDLILEELKVND